MKKWTLFLILFLFGCGGPAVPTNLPNQFIPDMSPSRLVVLDDTKHPTIYYDTVLKFSCVEARLEADTINRCIPNFVGLNAAGCLVDDTLTPSVIGPLFTISPEYYELPMKYGSIPSYKGEHVGYHRGLDSKLRFYSFEEVTPVPGILDFIHPGIDCSLENRASLIKAATNPKLLSNIDFSIL